MVFVLAAIGIASAVKFFVNDVPKKAVDARKLVVELNKSKTEGSQNKVYVDDLFIPQEGMEKIIACTNGCGKIIREAMESAEVLAPQLVAVGALHCCAQCGKYRNAA